MTEMSAPEITDTMRAEAARHPSGRLVAIDPEYQGREQVPPWAVRGAFPVTVAGEIDSEGYRANPNYRPGPRTLGWTEPATELDRALQLAATGYAGNQVVLAVLAEPGATLQVCATPSGDPVILDADGPSETPQLVAYTAPVHVPAHQPTVTLPVAVLVDAFGTADLRLNPGATPTATLPGQAIRHALASVSRPSS